MVDSDHAQQPTCFVAMPVTTPGSYIEKFRDSSHFQHVLDHLFSPALTKAGYQVIAPTSRGAQLIHAEIIRNLEQATLVLCDLSSLNANVFFELGIRTSLDRPVALVKDIMTERIPFDLSAINTHTYDESLAPWTLANEIEKIAEHVKAVDTGARAGNDMWHYFGLTKRATPAQITENPTEAKLDLLLAEVTALREENSIGLPPRRSRPMFFREGTSDLQTVSDAISRWLDQLMQRVLRRSYPYSISESSNGYRIELYGSITDSEVHVIEQEARAQLGLEVTVERGR
jgi:hypothetical protein